MLLLLLLATFVVVTGQTGFPGPGAMRRYRTHELQAVADRLNLLVCSADDPVRPPGASVDWIRSRVRLDHPGSVLLGPGDRPLIENPGRSATGTVPTWSMPVCTSHAPVG